MENVVSDEDGGQRLVKPVTDPQGFHSPAVSLVRQSAQTDLADTGIGRFTGCEIAGAKQKEDIQYTTGGIHENTNSLCFYGNLSIFYYTWLLFFCNGNCGNMAVILFRFSWI